MFYAVTLTDNGVAYHFELPLNIKTLFIFLLLLRKINVNAVPQSYFL